MITVLHPNDLTTIVRLIKGEESQHKKEKQALRDRIEELEAENAAQRNKVNP